MVPQLSASETVELSRDDLFSMLRNERRREVIHYLRDHDGGPVDLRDLSEYIAALENDCSAEAVTYEQRKRVQTALYQMHLPKLAEQGIVAYDRRAGRIEIALGAERCLPYLETDRDRPHRRWWRWYLVIAVVAAVPIGLAALGVPPFVSVSGLSYAAVACAAFFAVSVAQVAGERGRDA
jgi:DNA-binding transcriptional ArsR family regulator